MSGIVVHLVKRALLSAFYLLFIIVLLMTTWMVAAESLNEWVLSLAKWRNVMPEFLTFNLMYRVPAIPHPEVFLGRYLPGFPDIKVSLIAGLIALQAAMTLLVIRRYQR